ncbi:hypothetical protein F3Y22_tig00110474pilonHSYRG00092 [Hibiscus syriacus]|uniref:Uncharacterized protein n=1 Tax=Hibiscus syriacus TaxID=106335 RepID=A0A6A3AEQ8_HIBSY|nr:hypothetical protein F3Y22_tig00110474pilonHSYRG00092 [Hibiscus syriacus]
MTVIDWPAGMLKLPDSFTFKGSEGGVIQNTTSEAILVTLIAARDKALTVVGAADVNKLAVYASDQTHSTFTKVCKIAGISSRNIRSIPTTLTGGFSLSPFELRKAVEADLAAGLVPVYLCLNLGTTSTTAVDPIEPLTRVAKEHGMCFLDCCCLWVQNPKARRCSEHQPGILEKQTERIRFRRRFQGLATRHRPAVQIFAVMAHFPILRRRQPPSSYPFRRTDGQDVRRVRKIRPEVRNSGAEAVRAGVFPDPDENYGSDYTEMLNRKLLDWINLTGRVYMSHTKIGGVYVLTFAVGATLTDERHVVAAWKLIKEGADALLRTT